jgi:hypothetical protein
MLEDFKICSGGISSKIKQQNITGITIPGILNNKPAD